MSGKTKPGRAACAGGTTARTITKTNAKTPASLIDILSPTTRAIGSTIPICQNSTRVRPDSPEAISHESRVDDSTHPCILWWGCAKKSAGPTAFGNLLCTYFARRKGHWEYRSSMESDKDLQRRKNTC